MNPKIIFLGTSEFSAIILDKIIQGGYSPVLAVTEPDKPTGRHQTFTPSPVKTAAQNANIPLLQPEKILESRSKIQGQGPDLIIVAAYGQILPRDILDIPKYGCLNAHPSLLPNYRGPSPIQTAILNGDEKTGATIILMDEKIDHGPIIYQQEFKITNPLISYRQLHDELAKISANLLLAIIPRLAKNGVQSRPQNDSKATYTKIITKQDGRIDWSKSARKIDCQIRAFEKWPGAFTSFKSRSLKIITAGVFEAGTKKMPGEVFLLENNEIGVATGQNCLILRKLQLEGKKPTSADDFIHGHKDFVGTILK